MELDTVVHGGTIVTATETYQGSVGINGDKIVAIGPQDVLPKARRYIDASGKYVLPGIIDCHVHLGWDFDDWTRGSRGAAHAGITTLIPFALYDGQRGQTLPDAIRTLTPEVEAQSVVDFGFHFILNSHPYILDGIPEAVRMGVTSFKMFMTYKRVPNRMCSDEFLCRAMERIAEAGGLCQLHCENGDVIYYLETKALAEGRVAPRDFPQTCPDWTEEEAINRAIHIGALTRCPVYVVHLSSRVGLERIKEAQAKGQRVWAETCPQYLLLSDRAMDDWGPLAKIGPPLRPEEGPDREALWQGSEQGFIATVASDHSARAKHLKEPGWKNIFVDPQGKPVPFGSPSVETLVPLMFSEGVIARGLPVRWLARVLSENPARVFGLYPRKGTIRVGADADLLIYDPDYEGTIRAADHHSMAGWTLYEGWKVRGRPWMTLLRGRVLLNQGELEQDPGYGRFLRRTAPQPPLGGPVR